MVLTLGPIFLFGRMPLNSRLLSDQLIADANIFNSILHGGTSIKEGFLSFFALVASHPLSSSHLEIWRASQRATGVHVAQQ